MEATLIIGNVNEKPLGEILKGPELRGLLDRHEKEDFPDACKLCTRYESLYPSWTHGRLWKVAQSLVGKG